MNATAKEKLTHEDKIRLLAELLMSRPQILVATGLGDIRGRDLADHLLTILQKARR